MFKLEFFFTNIALISKRYLNFIVLLYKKHKFCIVSSKWMKEIWSVHKGRGVSNFYYVSAGDI